MIKGAQKRLIVVKTTGSPFFDEAYFVLRHEPQDGKQIKTDMLSEANRILRDSTLHTNGKRKRRNPLVSPFFWLGFFCAGGLFGLLCLCFLL